MASSSSSSPELPLSRSTNNNDQSLNIDHKLHEVLEDLSSRFILNLPDIELDSLERVCFQVEQAHWYYEDFVREQDPSLPTMTLKRFSNSLFHVCPLLSHWGNDHEQTFQSFLAYKTRVPVCGAIMLNEKWDKCLLVKGWKATSAWSFPKGKINEQEERPLCAIREVLEETGYDLAGQIDPENVVELSIRDQSLSLFIVPNVPEDFCFETRTRKEISKISWFKLTDLPTWKRNKTVPGKFYLITPFIGPLKNFLRTHKPRNLRRPNEKQQPTDVDDEGQQDLEAQDPVAIAHESSSQSSQENGDPHTPSPLYSEAIINKAEQGISHEMQKTLNMDNVDPHFAKLLSSLSLSVSKPSVDSVADLTIQGDPGVIQAVSTVSPTKATVLNTRSPSHASTARQSRPTRTPSAAPRTPPSASSTSLRTPSRLGRTHSPRIPVPPTSEQHLTSPSTNGSATETLPSPTTRRVAAPVDISPYLTRAATAAPPVPKQLKYISMLENVVKESERMTPRIERQVLVQNDRLPLPGGQPMFAPSHPPPGAPYGLSAEPSVIYSSPQRQTGNFPPPSLPSYPQLSSAPSDDAFVVRPRTTSAFHPVPSMASRPSLTDDQLRLVMSATGPRPPPMPPVGPYHLSPRRAGPPPPGPPPFIVQAPPPAGRAPQPNLRLIPPNQLPLAPYGEAPPLSAPALSPTFNRIPRANPTNNAQLLSILNTPSLPRATSSTSQPVLTNLGL